MSEGSVLTIIINYRTPDMTLEAAEAALVGMEGIPGEVLTIDNGSEDGSCDALRVAAEERGWLAGGRLRVICSPVNGGFGAGCNIGIKTTLIDGSRPDYFYLLNSDAFVRRNAIHVLRDFLQGEPAAGFAGSRIVGVDGELHDTAFRFHSIAGEFDSAMHTGVVSRLLKNSVVPMGVLAEQTRVDWTAGASLMIRREVIEEVGGFDETFFLYFEETELCHRAQRAGWQTWYLPESEVAHVGSVSTGMERWSRTPQYWLDARMHYFVKTRGALYAGAATLAWVVGDLLYGIRRLVSDKPQMNTPHFLRDLVSHAIRTLFSSKYRQSDVPELHTPLSEKPK